MATFQQAGDFLVTPVNGKMIKNGGNVVSYFCTPEGRLIHAVGGPVDAKRLLEEARWAVDAFDRVQSAKTNRKATVLREAHQFAANNTRSIEHIGRVGRQQLSFEQTRVHRLLSKYAYMPMSQLETTLFQALSGEHFETDRTVVFEAASAFSDAKKRNRPVLLILGAERRGAQQYPTLANYNARKPGTIDDQFNNRQVKRHLRRFSVIHIPKNQLAAFTNLVELTDWDTIETSARNWRTSHTCLLVNHSGEILLKLDINDTDHFADQLKSAMEIWKQHIKINSDSKSY